MILSMTGFGRGTAVRNGREITVELRSVNSRYFEYSSRIPRTCSYLDSRLKKQLNERYAPAATEMEGAAIGHAAFMFGVPFLVIRTMSDAADDDADESYDNFIDDAAASSAGIILKMLELSK